jgi:transposase
VLTGGQVHEATQAEAMLEGETAEHVIADRAYDAERIRQIIAHIGAQAVIPPHPCRRTAIAYDRHLYKERHVVECFINKLKHFRRIATRYDKTDTSFAAFVTLGATIIGLR